MTQRKIAFRAWEPFDKCMLVNVDIDKGDAMWGGRRLVGAPLMQFTGLLDSKGREIYEGDIVKVTMHVAYLLGKIGYIAWRLEEGAWWINDKLNSDETGFSPLGYGRIEDGAYEEKAGWLEIIGNRWEHPELLTTQP